MKPLKSSAPFGHLLETSLSRVTVSYDGCALGRVIVRKGHFINNRNACFAVFIFIKTSPHFRYKMILSD